MTTFLYLYLGIYLKLIWALFDKTSLQIDSPKKSGEVIFLLHLCSKINKFSTLQLKHKKNTPKKMFGRA
jgi:hypothetical protein